MLFVTLKNLQTRREKVVQFCIAGIGNEHGLKRIVDCLVIGDLIIGIGFVKRGAPSFLSSGLFGVRLLDEGLPSAVVLRLHLELLD